MTALKDLAAQDMTPYRTAQPIGQYRDHGCLVEILAVKGTQQITRFTYDPHVRIESHAHPDSESVQHFLKGSVLVWSKGRRFVVNAETARQNGPSVFVPRGWSHGAEIGPDGLQFISVERHYGAPVPMAGCPHNVWKVSHDSPRHD